VAAHCPDVVGYSVCTGSERYYLQLNRTLKHKLRFVAVFGGPHPTFFPELINEPEVDAICRGEGDLAFADFCRTMQVNGSPKAVPNFTVKTEAGISSLPPRPLLTDLDSLPFPDREIYYAVSPEIRNHAIRSFLASRGCPFACTYCFNPAMDTLYGGHWKRVRTRSPKSLVDEIASVVAACRTEFVAFRESIFPLQEDWLEEFGKEYSTRVGLPFYCHLRLDLLTARNVALLARAGCYSVNVGIETGNEELRRRLLNRTMSNDTMVQGCRLLRRHGIKILANNMLGLPGTTFEHDLETLHLNQRCKPDYALAMLWQPYPGTALTRYATENGFYVGKGDDMDFTYYNRSPLVFPNAKAKARVENLQKLFALAVGIPWITPCVRALTRLRPNSVFKGIFRTMYLIFHQTEIFRHRMTFSDWLLNFRHIAKEA
jgi:radical SAM superfamily enzyme YgiQ (UPF0313 family)